MTTICSASLSTRRPASMGGYLPALAWVLGGLALGSAMILGGDSSLANPTNSRLVATVQATAEPLRLKGIEVVQLGDRVAGRNPIREQVEANTPDSASWRAISLRIETAPGRNLEIELLRPLSWVESQDIESGRSVPMNLPEMGAVGNAIVVSVGPCPPIASGDGAVVTGRFIHPIDETTRVLRLQIEGQPEPTGVTANHPYWSVDRRTFVPAGELHPGERVDTSSGLRRVVYVAPGYDRGLLYNLETTEHVYRVGSLGTLVHNSCPGVGYHGTDVPTLLHFLNGGRLDAAVASANKIDGPSGFFLSVMKDDAYFFAARRSGNILEFRFSQAAQSQLDAAGLIRQRIPNGKSYFPLGDELIVQPDQFDLFNRLMGSGDITIVPSW